MKDDRVYLAFILECIRDIREFVDGDLQRLDEKRMLYAVERALQVMAESTQRLSPELRRAHPEVEWPAIAGLRNVLVHDYFGVDVERIREIVSEDLPVFERAVERIRAALEDQEKPS
ncbi:MAG TPA: DUF86 domain-containing protein [Methanoregulaceae archaeon]|nr:DUF86 domain-containing protein [Methanoregulaceae archaeon]